MLSLPAAVYGPATHTGEDDDGDYEEGEEPSTTDCCNDHCPLPSELLGGPGEELELGAADVMTLGKHHITENITIFTQYYV